MNCNYEIISKVLAYMKVLYRRSTNEF